MAEQKSLRISNACFNPWIYFVTCFFLLSSISSIVFKFIWTTIQLYLAIYSKCNSSSDLFCQLPSIFEVLCLWEYCESQLLLLCQSPFFKLQSIFTCICLFAFWNLHLVFNLLTNFQNIFTIDFKTLPYNEAYSNSCLGLHAFRTAIAILV